jgi:uncharacterized protein (DUF488 family)
VLISYGHGTETAERTIALLQAASVSLVVDIRIAPGSTRNPQFAKAELERWLPAAGIGYRWERCLPGDTPGPPCLGGYRKPSPGNPDIAWREDMYRGYAEHMRGPDFLAAIGLVLAEATSPGMAVMCSESSLHHCHRRLVADFAQVARGVPVRHLAHDGSLADHVPSALSWPRRTGRARTASSSTTTASPHCCSPPHRPPGPASFSCHSKEHH